jgi:hypothetical protein
MIFDLEEREGRDIRSQKVLALHEGVEHNEYKD